MSRAFYTLIIRVADRLYEIAGARTPSVKAKKRRDKRWAPVRRWWV